MPERMIVIGNPGNRRTAGLQEARARLGMPPALVVSYADLLHGKAGLAEAAKACGWNKGGWPPLLRLDAPGESFVVERALIALGAPDCPQAGHSEDRLLPYGDRPDPMPISWDAALSMREQHGRLYHPSQWFRGFGRLLARLEQEAASCWQADVNWLNTPADVLAMFDKRHTHRVLQQAGVPVAPLLLSGGAPIANYEALKEAMMKERMHRVFVKLASGSGASGVIAYQLNPRTGAELAVTTMEIKRHIARPPSFFNLLKPRRYTEQADISLLVNWLLKHGAHVERWIAKSCYKGDAFDIRQLVVCGKACHSIARVSRTPITNLHLRSKRMELTRLGLNEAALTAIRDSAEKALAAFSGSRVAGIDVIIDSQRQRPYIIDVNPFGDLIYRVQYEGSGTYDWELRQLSEQH
ncbi:STM4014 family protein [Paenibacillus sp. GCM10027626]|uniref:STM4014 family protein n=1 Tax=Paenibacillus sp. GCM10027626 TaxID=3273411 RepID=UPI00362A8456